MDASIAHSSHKEIRKTTSQSHLEKHDELRWIGKLGLLLSCSLILPSPAELRHGIDMEGQRSEARAPAGSSIGHPLGRILQRFCRCPNLQELAFKKFKETCPSSTNLAHQIHQSTPKKRSFNPVFLQVLSGPTHRPHPWCSARCRFRRVQVMMAI